MSLFHYLQLQEVEPDDPNSTLDYFERDEMSLEDTIDGEALDDSWRRILESGSTDGEA